MRIRIMRPLPGMFSGRDINGQFPAPYTVIDAPDSVARALIDAGCAEVLPDPKPEPVVETVADSAPEIASKRVGKTATRKSRAGSQKRTFSASKE